MPPDSLWSDKFNKSHIHLNVKEIAWTNFMNQCLLQTEIFKRSENANECFINLDANVVRDMRHKMVQESSKVPPISKTLIQTEALKILRNEYHNTLLKQKEKKLVEREIVKLRQILESRRFDIIKKLEETNNKAEAMSKTAKCHRKPRKTFDRLDFSGKIDAWLAGSSQTLLETNGFQNILTKDIEVQTKSQYSENPSFSDQKIDIINVESKRETQLSEECGLKNEIMKRFFENDVQPLKEEFQDGVKEQIEINRTSEIQKNQKSVGRISRNLKNYAENKNKSKKKINGNKIEKFLTRLKESKMNQEKRIFMVNRRARINAWETKEKNRNTDEKLKKLMLEAKLSQKEAYQKLQEAKTICEIDTKFLLRMEERRNERIKRRNEFEARKLKQQEEKENLKRLREEEKKQKDEEEKRKNLEELREKRKAEKQKKEEEKQKKVKLRENMEQAMAHYKIFLLRVYGLRPWMNLMKIRELQQQQAKSFYEMKLKQKTFNKWRTKIREEINLKTSRAEAFYEKVLKKNCLIMWEEYSKKSRRQCQAAMDWFDFKVTEKNFKKWLKFTKSERLKYLFKENTAVLHYQWKLQIKYLKILQNYPKLKRLEEAKENRKWKWRQKVKEILPDYEPVSTFKNL